jgi:hypothetical protein
MVATGSHLGQLITPMRGAFPTLPGVVPIEARHQACGGLIRYVPERRKHRGRACIEESACESDDAVAAHLARPGATRAQDHEIGIEPEAVNIVEREPAIVVGRHTAPMQRQERRDLRMVEYEAVRREVQNGRARAVGRRDVPEEITNTRRHASIASGCTSVRENYGRGSEGEAGKGRGRRSRTT